jgi:hypothetical protein
MILYNETTLHVARNDEDKTVTLRHSPMDLRRKKTIQYFCSHGCRMVVDPANLPPWLTDLAADLQAEVAENHMELANIYSCSIPETATIQGRDLALFEFLGEIRHLRMAHPAISPEDLKSLKSLDRLEILTLVGSSFGDSHVDDLPEFEHLRYLDLQTTAVTKNAAQRLHVRYPGATIYL